MPARDSDGSRGSSRAGLAELSAQPLEHERVDLVLTVDALLQVILARCPVLEPLEAEDGKAVPDLGSETVVDGDPLGTRRRDEELLVDLEDAPELCKGTLVIVHAQVDEDVGQSGEALLRTDDENRG